MRFGMAQLVVMLFGAIPAAFEQMAVVPDDGGKRLYIVQVYGQKAVVRSAALYQVEQYQATALAVWRCGGMPYAAAIEKNDGIAVFMGGNPGAAGIAVFREQYFA